MATVPEAPAEAGKGGVSQPIQSLKTCLSCRVVSGGGMIAAAAYVYLMARKTLRSGGPVTIGTMGQITFAASVAVWGIIILTDPTGKSHKP